MAAPYQSQQLPRTSAGTGGGRGGVQSRRSSLPLGSLGSLSTAGGAAMSAWKIPGSSSSASQKLDASRARQPHEEDVSIGVPVSYFDAPIRNHDLYPQQHNQHYQHFQPQQHYQQPRGGGGNSSMRRPDSFAHSYQPADHATTEMKFIHRTGNGQPSSHQPMRPQYANGVLKLVPPTSGFHPRPQQVAAAFKRTTSHDVCLPEGTLHVWIYQARHLTFRRLFETMYERHGLRLRVYVGSRTTQDVGEIYETRRNYGGNMANPRWRLDQDDARDNSHGHFGIPLSRKSLRSETELIVEIVCGILVVAHSKISLPALFLGSFGTTLEHLGTQNMQFRPHWFPLAGEDSGLIEMALEFIPTRLVEQQQQQPQYPVQQVKQPQRMSNQPESEYDDYEDDQYDHEYPPGNQNGYEQQYHQPKQYHQPQYHNPQRRGSGSQSSQRDSELDREREREYEARERHEKLRRQRFEMLDEQHEVRPQDRARSATTASSSSSSSAKSTRFVLPRRSSLSDIDRNHDFPQQPPYEVEDYEEEVVIMDSYESSPPPSEFSGYELHDSRYDHEGGVDELHDSRYNIPHESSEGYDTDNGEGYDSQSSMGPDSYDELSMSASSSWASVSTLTEGASQENLLNKQLWDLYRYGISDESPEEIFPSARPSAVDDLDRESSMSSLSSSIVSRTMSQASNYSVAFSDASEMSMMSREASTCASEILTYNDRIQHMEEAIRAERERRLAEEAASKATAAIAPQPQVNERPRAQVPAPINTVRPARPAPSLTPYGWERPPHSTPLASPAASEPIVLDSRKGAGVVLFDVDHIPVKGDAGQTDPALAAYRAKMLARRRSLPIHMLSGGMGMGPGLGGPQGAHSGFPPSLVREMSAPNGRLSMSGQPPRFAPTSGSFRHSRDDTELPRSTNTRFEVHPANANGRASPFQAGIVTRAPHPRSAVVDSPSTNKAQPKDDRQERHHDSERHSTSSIDLPGPPGLRRARSSSMHSISDLLRDQSFRIHNLPAEGAASSSSSTQVRHSVSDNYSNNGSRSERKLSKASSYASSSDSSTGLPVMPTVNTASSGPPRVRRNSKGGGNVVQINDIALGVGKFINVGNFPGVIRYIGPTMFAPGQWIGIELVEKKGKHNGTVQNVQYFECAQDHGIFIRAERLDIST